MNDIQVVRAINSEYPQVFKQLLVLLANSNYADISLVIVHTLYHWFIFHSYGRFKMVPYFSIRSEVDCENIVLLANQINVVFAVSKQTMLPLKQLLAIRCNLELINHCSRFGGFAIEALNKNNSMIDWLIDWIFSNDWMIEWLN